MKNWKDLLIVGLLGVLLGQGVNLAYAEEAPAWATPPAGKNAGDFSVCGKLSVGSETPVPAGWTVVGYSAVPQIVTKFGQKVQTTEHSKHYMLLCY